MVFVCSPYRGDIPYNVQMAQAICKELIKWDYVPVAPHLIYPDILDDNIEEERDRGIKCGLALLSRCDLMVVYDSEGISEGMKEEITHAKDQNIEILYVSKEGQNEEA